MSYRAYPASKFLEVQRLIEEGWTQRAVAKHVGVSTTTVQRWIHPKADEANRARRRAAYTPRGNQHRSDEFLMARAEQLRNAGLPYSAIAVVLNLDHGVKIDRDVLRYQLVQKRGMPKDMRRNTFPVAA